MERPKEPEHRPCPSDDRAGDHLDGIRPVLLEVAGLHKAFGGHVVLRDVNLELRECEVVLLRGDNGSGKTTLLNILTGNLAPNIGTIRYLADGTPREYRFPRKWWQDLNPFDHFTPEYSAREGMGRLWQDVRLFKAQSLRDNIAVSAPSNVGENPIIALLFPARVHKSESKICEQADLLLARLGLAGRETSSADKISLGQSKRVAIARAVSAGARILFLDEPLAGLDREGITDVLALLQALVDEHRLTLVIVEHVLNLDHLRHLATTDWILADGRVDVSNLRANQRKPEAATSRTATPRPYWFSRLATPEAEVTDELLPNGAFLTRIRRPRLSSAQARPTLDISRLTVFRGPRLVIGLGDIPNEHGFDLALRAGEIAILQAPNGWGKTTLIESIAGVCPVASGDLRLNGESIMGRHTWERSRLGIRLLSGGGTFFRDLTVSEARRVAGLPREPDRHANRPLSQLSGGELKRVAAMCFLDSTPMQVALLDEPFAALDRTGVDALCDSIHSMSAEVILIAEPYRM